MTSAVTTHLSVANPRAGIRRSARKAPRGMPRWLWLLGVAVHPLGAPDADGRSAWVVSTGGGVVGVAALFFDTTTEQHHAEAIRKDQP